MDYAKSGKLAILSDPRILDERFRKLLECACRGYENEIMLFDMGTDIEADMEKNKINHDVWSLAQKKPKKKYETNALIV